MSFLGNWNCDQEEVYGIQDHFLPDSWGLTKVVQHLAKEIFAENDPRLRLNETVTEVHFALDNDRSIPDDIPKEGVLVKTASGNKYYGRFCIITFTVRKASIPELCSPNESHIILYSTYTST